ncbi:MAG: 3-phosphoshikimate 1-carboxyvinyltransferase [Bacilli bacterium]|jgi:3-phosphoshikimate 1-carboxyvinyltransferase|nr:3-phosphoshikimate 1-carboxyvinyltransferase [Bacilli bacterium]MDD3121136.1 3-phosphoshikimate 1-carboxyvinyltransferase [Bacilli bacterium]MDD4482386.1 3-phosphoshikimate 1-carboxyvinyltransferase [Bacilli bacterium]MDY0363896.1 3-phosphoshikimate 1-carboxyvinyltransferase [Bacilli bacterium]
MIRIHPSKNRNKVIVPSSKSLLHRYLFAAALAEGKTVIKNVSFSNDINDSIEFLKLFKKKIKVNKNTIIVYEDKNNNIKNASLIMKDSATTLRLAIPVLGALSNKTIIRTSERLLERPFSVYQDIFLKQKLNFIFGKDIIEFTGPLKAGLYEIPGFISSQFISGLLFALPLLHSDSVLKVIRPIESLSYVNLTLSVLKKAQIKVEKKQNLYLINGNQKYQSFNINCEGDYSQAAFFIGLGLINSKVIIGNFNKNSIQGDKQMIDIVKKLNGNIMEKGNKIIVKPSVLRGGIIDLKDCPDLGPILMVIAATVNDKFEFINASRLRIKESDRVASMEVELKKIGVDIYSTFDSVIINGGINVNQEINFSSHNDHRIFMALAVLATILPFGATITNEECIKKSYPKFIYDLKRMNVLIE